MGELVKTLQMDTSIQVVIFAQLDHGVVVQLPDRTLLCLRTQSFSIQESATGTLCILNVKLFMVKRGMKRGFPAIVSRTFPSRYDNRA